MNYETEIKEILKRHAAELAEFESNAAMAVPKHTPTPWESNNNLLKTDALIEIFSDKDEMGEKPIADVYSYENFDEAEANAAFIVRACNCHDELVKTIKVLSESLQEAVSLTSVNRGYNRRWQLDIDQARNALEKAEG